MSKLEIAPVETLDEAQAIARVRNTGADMMTQSRQLISPTDQAEWFTGYYELAKSRGDTYAFLGSVDGQEAAYGLINRIGRGHWLTGVIVPEFQGQGHGRELFTFLRDYTVSDLEQPVVLLDVLNTNHRAMNLYKSLGFEAAQIGSHVTVMEYQA